MTAVQHLHENGFALIPDVVSPTRCDDVIVDFTTAQSQSENRAASMRHVLQRIPSVKKLCESAQILNLMRSVLGGSCFPVRGILFDKTPDANWKVVWHQDLTIAVAEKIETDGFAPWSVKDGVIHVQSPQRTLEKMLTLRLHLDDCDVDNGPLRVLRGSHSSGKLSASEIQNWRARVEETTICQSRGGALLMRPLLLHASSQATAPRHRRVLHLEWANETLPNGLHWLNS